MALNEGSNGGETGSSGRFQFLCRTFFFFFFSLRRDAVSPCSEKPKTKNIFPWRSSLLLTHTRDFPHFQCFTCKNVSYRIQKSKQSVLSPSFFFFFFFFFASIQFCIEKYVCFFSLSLLLSFPSFFLFFFFNSRRLFVVDPELVSVRSYMCCASIMSKYLASMI